MAVPFTKFTIVWVPGSCNNLNLERHNVCGRNPVERDVELPEVVLTGVDHVELGAARAVDHVSHFQTLQLPWLTRVLATQQKPRDQ